MMKAATVRHRVVALLGVALTVLSALEAAAGNSNHSNHGNHAAGDWVVPRGFPAGHNGGFRERLVEPAAGKKPHIMMILFGKPDPSNCPRPAKPHILVYLLAASAPREYVSWGRSGGGRDLGTSRP